MRKNTPERMREDTVRKIPGTSLMSFCSFFCQTGKEAVRNLLDAGDGQSDRESCEKAAAHTYQCVGCRTGDHQVNTPEESQSRKQGKDTDGEKNGPWTFTSDSQKAGGHCGDKGGYENGQS